MGHAAGQPACLRPRAAHRRPLRHAGGLDDGWKTEVESRLDASATAITTVQLNLGATIEHVRVAMNGIVQDVRAELQHKANEDRVLIKQLDAVVFATAAKFTEIEVVVNKVAHDMVVQVASMDQRTAALAAQLGPSSSS